VSNEPQRWLDRLVSACVSVFMGALALYGAVWLLSLVWTQLLVIIVVVVVATVAIAVWRFRQSRW
jgi:heme/copper-type cytochrome/quinol oxidase subunit 2